MIDSRKIFGAFIIAIALFFFWPTVIGSWQEASALRAAVAEREDLLAKRQEILTDVTVAYAEYQDKLTEQDNQKFASLIPVRKDTAELISAMQEIADNSGIAINEVQINEGKSSSGSFKSFSLNIDMRGSYTSLRSFLEGLEQYVRLLNVNVIQITSDTQNPGRLRFTVRADTYFLQ